MVTREEVLAALEGVRDPHTGDSIVATGAARAITIDAGEVRFVIEIDPKRSEEMEAVRVQAEGVVRRLDSVTKVSAMLTAHSEKLPPNLRTPKRTDPRNPQAIPGVKRIVAIASGKGGVGKSTVAANLACAVSLSGRRVGLLDADVYGPSQPRMLGISDRPASPDGKIIIPLHNHGVTMMSIGLMTGEDQAMIWRGPMLMGALQQMMGQVRWGELDVLFVDLPPGTGDVQLTLTQKFQVDGAIVVSTPQEVALADARKGINMFNQMKTPILGLVENMAAYICPNCGHEDHIFGQGGVAAEAKKLGVPLLAQIPLSPATRVAADSGTPIVVCNSQSAPARVFMALARDLIDQDLV
ncbi:MAG: Mrp/NBP35 family ATP-binding protein [Aestuariivita sp.]|nr:Mrp/NBP35 family ATP-binding protein [Aestuariivita sp.]MCY4201814.1 Mrp/NBP35 family ATP-binding protein [Aestuariivita sp.]MCY4289118.1 Mrp/NBP35 family ATP-binding protein [Aestuariivita sp.]MCY4347718.1 Mrp/NBP35 family ATP-binding protein [Aestuariivita sp.]